MDFSKWRKIFYIIAIVSMLITIKTKVFGYSSYAFVGNNGRNYTCDIYLEENNLTYFAIFNTQNQNYFYCYASSSPMTFTESSGDYYISTTTPNFVIFAPRVRRVWFKL